MKKSVFCDAYTVIEGGSLIVASPWMLNRDACTGGESKVISASIIAGPRNGHLILHEDGGFEYTPDCAHDRGGRSDFFVYQVINGGEIAQSTVFINIERIQRWLQTATCNSCRAARGEECRDMPGILSGLRVRTGETGQLALLRWLRRAATGQFAQAGGGHSSGHLRLLDKGVLAAPGMTPPGSDSFSYQVLDAEGVVSNTVTVTVRVDD